MNAKCSSANLLAGAQIVGSKVAHEVRLWLRVSGFIIGAVMLTSFMLDWTTASRFPLEENWTLAASHPWLGFAEAFGIWGFVAGITASIKEDIQFAGIVAFFGFGPSTALYCDWAIRAFLGAYKGGWLAVVAPEGLSATTRIALVPAQLAALAVLGFALNLGCRGVQLLCEIGQQASASNESAPN